MEGRGSERRILSSAELPSEIRGPDRRKKTRSIFTSERRDLPELLFRQSLAVRSTRRKCQFLTKVHRGIRREDSDEVSDTELR